MKPDEAKARQAYALGVQAYIWGYPLVVMQRSRDAMTKWKTPPVGAFWSTTMYDAKKRLMVENSLNRYKIGSADKLEAGPDGSITIHIQADFPGKDMESNWLPAPKEPFYMLFRMYLPKIEVLNGQYELPGVVSVK